MKPARGRVSKKRTGGGGGKRGANGSGGGRRRPPKGLSQRPSKVAAREKAAAERKAENARKCEAGRKAKELAERAAAGSAAAGDAPVNDRKKKLKKKKRVRGQKHNLLTVLGPGDNVPVAQGGPKVTDLAPKKADDDKLPWKTRRLLALMQATTAAKGTAAQAVGVETSTGKRAVMDAKVGPRVEAGDSSTESKGVDDGEEMDIGSDHAMVDGGAEHEEPKPKKVKFDGMLRGETFMAFKKRLREETKRARFEVARAGNRQREKKRLYYEKRRARAERRARRKSGAFSESEGEGEGEDDDWESDGEHGHQSVNLWADMLRERMAEQQRSRKPRRHREDGGSGSVPNAEVRFGEQVERPPEFANVPVRPGRGGVGVKPKGKVVLSDAAAILEKAE